MGDPRLVLVLGALGLPGQSWPAAVGTPVELKRRGVCRELRGLWQPRKTSRPHRRHRRHLRSSPVFCLLCWPFEAAAALLRSAGRRPEAEIQAEKAGVALLAAQARTPEPSWGDLSRCGSALRSWPRQRFASWTSSAAAWACSARTSACSKEREAKQPQRGL